MNSYYKLMDKIGSYFGDDKRNFVVVVLITFFLYYYTSPRGFESDIDFWENWGIFSLEHGFKNIYQSGTDYMPVNLYILNLFATIFHGHFDLKEYFYLIKVFYVIVDIIFLVIVLKEFQIKKDWLLCFVLLLFNPAYLINNYSFGQVDSLQSVLIFFSIVAVYYRKVEWSYFLITLSILTKLQAIFFIPIVGLLSLPIFIKQPLRFIYCIVIVLVTTYIIVLPFEDPMAVYNVAFNSVDKYPFVTMNAMNIWNLIFWGRNPWSFHDTDTFLNITYKQFGLVMFLIASFIALFPMLKNMYEKIVQKSTSLFSLDLILITSALIGLNFYYFPTQMHERYSHPVMYFLIAYSLKNRTYRLLGFYSVLYFLSMERVVKFLKTYNYGIAPFDPKVLSIFHGVLLLLLFKELFKISSEKKPI